MDKKIQNLSELASSLDTLMARGVLGTLEIKESEDMRLIAVLPFYVVGEYSLERKSYIKIGVDYAVNCYICEPSVEEKIEVLNKEGKHELFYSTITNRVQRFHDYIARVFLLHDTNTNTNQLKPGMAFYAFVKRLPYSENLPKHQQIHKRWFSRNLYVDNNFVNILPFEITEPTESSLAYATRKDNETKKQRDNLIDLHVRRARMPVDVRQRVVPKEQPRNEKFIFSWD